MMTGVARGPHPARPMAPVISVPWRTPMVLSSCRQVRPVSAKASSRGCIAGSLSPMSLTTDNIAALPVAGTRDTLGRPLQDLRISVTDRCNFRCPYCMPRERYGEHYRFLNSSERLSFAEILRLTRLFVRLGVRKIRITGGEPLLRSGLEELIG